MATLRFDGASDNLRGTGQGAMNSALTLAILYKLGKTGECCLFYTHRSAGITSDAFLFSRQSSTTALDFYNNVGTSPGSSFTSAVGDWLLVAMTRAAGSGLPRYHAKNITTGTAWIHHNGSSNLGNPPSSAGGGMRIGTYQNGGASNDLQGDVALVAWWDGTALTDPQVESLAATLKASDWHALAPSSLTQLNTATPTDLESLETWTVTGPTLTGTDPPGWTFDGVGGAPPVSTVAPAVTGTAINGQTLTCTTGTWTDTPTGYAYQWKRAGANISGATASTYTLVSADKSTSVKCTVTASNAAGSTSADSNAVSVSSLDALPDVGDVLIRTSTGWITLN